MSSPLPPDPQAAQAGLALTLYDAILALWPQLDLSNLRESLPEFTAAVALEVQRHAQASATLAAQQYRRQRVAAGVGRGYTPIPSSPPPVEQIAQSVDWAVQPLWNSAVLGGPATEAEQAAGSAIADAKARLAASTERLVLDAGRDTIITNAQRDRQAKGWARIPEPNACSFCAMLATRGAVYRSERSGGFKTHDNCRCHAEPVFTAYEPSAQVRQWEQVYKDAKPNRADGPPSKAKQIAFRRAYEGRTAPTK